MSAMISTFMTEDHHYCDLLLASFERAVSAGNWEQAVVAGEDLTAALGRHFSREEDRLFPELLAVDPRASGPVRVMTMEHRQMRTLLADLAGAWAERDQDTCLGVVETLHFLIQQHNAKEEGILYPLADQGLASREDQVLNSLKGD